MLPSVVQRKLLTKRRLLPSEAQTLKAGTINFAQHVLGRTESLRNDSFWRWFWAVIAVVVSFGLRFVLDQHLPAGFPYLTFFPAVIIITFLAGLGPGVFVGICGGLAAWFFFIAPFGSFVLTGPGILALAFYIFIVTVDILLIHWMHVALHRLQKEQKLSQRHALERDLLFKEMQHRVSNNLAVVGSLLSAQRRALQEGGAASNALAQAASRVSLIAKMQRELYDPSRQTLDFARYLKQLGPDILEAMDAHHVSYVAEVETVEVSSDLAVPLGLIATELVSNSVEHAFPAGRAGTIRVRMATIGQTAGGPQVQLVVSDDGPGWPDNFTPDTSRNLGMRIVISLAQQIGGTFTYSNDPATGGASSSLTFVLAQGQT
jgi:two-component system, sensor histidine kinase PdtaS